MGVAGVCATGAAGAGGAPASACTLFAERLSTLFERRMATGDAAAAAAAMAAAADEDALQVGARAWEREGQIARERVCSLHPFSSAPLILPFEL